MNPNPFFEIMKMNAYIGLGVYFGLEKLPWRRRIVIRFYIMKWTVVFRIWAVLIKEEVPPNYEGSTNQGS